MNQNASRKRCGFWFEFYDISKRFSMHVKKYNAQSSFYSVFTIACVLFYEKYKKVVCSKGIEKCACTKLQIIDYQYCAPHYQKLKNHFNRKASSTVNLYSQQHTKSKQALKIENVISFVKRKTSKISLFCANAPP